MKLDRFAAYEYKTIPLTSSSLGERELNELGRHGWLLVATLPHLVFVRQVAAESQVQRAPEQQRLLTVKQVSERLNMSRSKVYELLAAGKLRPVKVGRLTRVPSTELESFILSSLEGPK